MSKAFQMEQNGKLFQLDGKKKDFIFGTTSVFPVEIPGAERTVMFAHQANDADCGPCLVVNACNALGAFGYDSPISVRVEANNLRAQNRQVHIEDGGWLFVNDVVLAMQQKGLLVEQYSIKSPAMEAQARDQLSTIQLSETPFVAFSGVGRHFRGIYWNGQSYFLLDSMLTNIPQARIGDIESMIRSGKTSNRDETFAIATLR